VVVLCLPIQERREQAQGIRITVEPRIEGLYLVVVRLRGEAVRSEL
jgi:hypothetical protein